MKNCDSHFYLYAKGHYQRGDLINDLKSITAHRCLLLPEHVAVQDIEQLLLYLVWKYLQESSGNPEQLFVDLFTSLNPGERRFFGGVDNEDIPTTVIRKCLSVLRHVSVMNGDIVIVELDSADSTILPLSKVLKDITNGNDT